MVRSTKDGVFDGWTSRRGKDYERMVRQARAALWASVAEYELETLWNERRAKGTSGEKGVPTAPFWLQKWPWQDYLGGEAKPQAETVRKVRPYAPRSYEVYQHDIWSALSPRTDVNDCLLIAHHFGGEAAARRLAEDVMGGQAVVFPLVELDSLALLIVAIRISIEEKKCADAFNYACALLYGLSLLAAEPSYLGAHDQLCKAVCVGVLNGISNGIWIVDSADEALTEIGSVIGARCSEIAWLTGGALRLLWGPPLQRNTIADLFHPVASTLSRPADGVSADLVDLLQRGTERDVTRLRDSAVTRLEAKPLFRRCK
jgi:hypothetical protein